MRFAQRFLANQPIPWRQYAVPYEHLNLHVRERRDLSVLLAQLAESLQRLDAFWVRAHTLLVTRIQGLRRLIRLADGGSDGAAVRGAAEDVRRHTEALLQFLVLNRAALTRLAAKVPRRYGRRHGASDLTPAARVHAVLAQADTMDTVVFVEHAAEAAALCDEARRLWPSAAATTASTPASTTAAATAGWLHDPQAGLFLNYFASTAVAAIVGFAQTPNSGDVAAHGATTATVAAADDAADAHDAAVASRVPAVPSVDVFERTVLHYCAAQAGPYAAVPLGAVPDIDVRWDTPDHQGLTPVDYACLSGSQCWATRLIRAACQACLGTSPRPPAATLPATAATTATGTSRDRLTGLLARWAWMATLANQNHVLQTVLQTAAALQMPPAAIMHVREPLLPCIDTGVGRVLPHTVTTTLLILAVKRGQTETCQVLLNHYARASALTPAPTDGARGDGAAALAAYVDFADTRFGRTALMWATLYNAMDIVTLLLRGLEAPAATLLPRADVALRDYAGLNAHEYAVYYAYPPLALLLQACTGHYPPTPTPPVAGAAAAAASASPSLSPSLSLSPPLAAGEALPRSACQTRKSAHLPLPLLQPAVVLYLGTYDTRHTQPPLIFTDPELQHDYDHQLLTVSVSASHAHLVTTMVPPLLGHRHSAPIVFSAAEPAQTVVRIDLHAVAHPHQLRARAIVPLAAHKMALWREKTTTFSGQLTAPFMSAALDIVGHALVEIVIVTPYVPPPPLPPVLPQPSMAASTSPASTVSPLSPRSPVVSPTSHSAGVTAIAAEEAAPLPRWTPPLHGEVHVVGHRGSGMNRPFKGSAPLQLGENTLLSFTNAGRFVDMVEMDVQLTKDGVPVIYHDFTTTDDTGFDIPIASLSASQFAAVHSHLRPAMGEKGIDRFSQWDTQASGCPSHGGGAADAPGTVMLASASSAPSPQHQHQQQQQQQQQRRRTRSFGDGRHVIRPAGSAPWPLWPAKGNSDGTIQSPFCTLAEALRRVPGHIGFNIELKYPNLKEALLDELVSPDLNAYCHAVLAVVHAHAGTRPITFSSFHPEAVMCMALKQTTYPVLFLTEGGKDDVWDERGNSLHAAVAWAQRWGLAGIVTAFQPIEEAPYLIGQIRRQGLACFTYGTRNNDAPFVAMQRAYGVDAVIVDHVNKIQPLHETQRRRAAAAAAAAVAAVAAPAATATMVTTAAATVAVAAVVTATTAGPPAAPAAATGAQQPSTLGTPESVATTLTQNSLLLSQFTMKLDEPVAASQPPPPLTSALASL